MNENESTVEVVASESAEPIATPTVSESPEESYGAESMVSEPSVNESAESETVYDDTDATVADAKNDILDDLASMVADKLKENQTEDGENETEETEETEIIVDEENPTDADVMAVSDSDSATPVVYASDYGSDILRELMNIERRFDRLEEKTGVWKDFTSIEWNQLSTTDFLLLVVIIILLFRVVIDFGGKLFNE